MTSTTLILVSVLLVWVFVKIVKWYTTVKYLQQLPGPKGLPILGNLLEVMVPADELLRAIVNFCSPGTPLTRIWLTWFHPYVVLHQAHTVEALLSSSKFITKSSDYDFLTPWLGTGLLTSTGKKWSKRRRLLTPAFHFKILEDFVDVFNEKAKVLVEQLEQYADGHQLDIFPVVTLCTLDVILETAMGLNMDVQRQKDNPYVLAVQRISLLINERQRTPWYHLDFIYNLTPQGKEFQDCLRTLHHLSLSTIRERRVQTGDGSPPTISQGKGKKNLPFLDLLIQYSKDDESVTDEDIREEVDTFMFEGHDTTASAITFTLFLLGHHPQIQEKVQAEVDRVLGDSDIVSSDQLKELRYLECCVKEALRHYPSVPMFGRHLHEDFHVTDGITIPQGTTIAVFPYMLHMDSKQFPEPEDFNPDHFTPENNARRHPYAYVPFSAGPRNCIGQKFALMEEKIVLALLLREYSFESLQTMDELTLLPELILRPKDGVIVKLKRRTQTQLFTSEGKL